MSYSRRVLMPDLRRTRHRPKQARAQPQRGTHPWTCPGTLCCRAWRARRPRGTIGALTPSGPRPPPCLRARGRGTRCRPPRRLPRRTRGARRVSPRPLSLGLHRGPRHLPENERRGARPRPRLLDQLTWWGKKTGQDLCPGPFPTGGAAGNRTPFRNRAELRRR
jgi:hypothetical protein